MMSNPIIKLLDGSELPLLNSQANWYLSSKKLVETVNSMYNNPTFIGCFNSRSNYPAYLFWQEKAHPQGSNYFLVYSPPGSHKSYITDGKPEADVQWKAILKPNEFVLYSGYRHDYQEHEGVIVDGGNEYLS